MRLFVAICLVALLAMSCVPANAEVTVNEKIEVSLYTESCAEPIAGSGPLHILMSFTINGNNVSGYYHFQPQGLSITGLTSGTRYQATGITQSAFKGSLQNGQYTTTYVNNFNIIGRGPDNNLLVHETSHLTINANGTVTVTHDNFSFECR